MSVNVKNIKNVNSNYLKCIELENNRDVFDKKWFLIDGVGNSTPVFKNVPNIISVSEDSCLLLGQEKNKVELYYVKGSKEDRKEFDQIYRTIPISGEIKKITDIDSTYMLVETDRGMFYYNKKELKKSTDTFDSIKEKVVDGKEVIVFKEVIKEDNYSKTIIGNMTKSGRIGNFIYDDSINGFRTTPEKENNYYFEQLDYEFLYNELAYYSREKEKENCKNINKLVKLNNHVVNK